MIETFTLATEGTSSQTVALYDPSKADTILAEPNNAPFLMFGAYRHDVDLGTTCNGGHRVLVMDRNASDKGVA